jgi:hypothetical protein
VGCFHLMWKSTPHAPLFFDEKGLGGTPGEAILRTPNTFLTSLDCNTRNTAPLRLYAPPCTFFYTFTTCVHEKDGHLQRSRVTSTRDLSNFHLRKHKSVQTYRFFPPCRGNYCSPFCASDFDILFGEGWKQALAA